MEEQSLRSQLRESGAMVLIAAIPTPAILIDDEAWVIFANPLAQDLLPSLRFNEPLVRALRAPDITDGIRRVVSGGLAETTLWEARVPVEQLFRVDIAPLKSEEGKVVALLLTLRDLTDARNVERMRVDFIANASHELRTPLASLLGFVETLQGSAQNDTVARKRFLAIMREQGGRMARLIDDLLSLSRIEQKQHLRPETQVDLVHIVGHVRDTLAPLAEEMNVDLKIHTPGSVLVTGDYDELVRVAENLIENAIKYGTRRDEQALSIIDISVGRRKTDGMLRVQDYGSGIAPEHLPRLTERFYRIDPGQSRAKNGTGLGLAIVKHIIARHRGRLTIESHVGQGSTFTVFIPLAKSVNPIGDKNAL